MDANSISKLRPEIENLARNRGQKLDFETKSEIEYSPLNTQGVRGRPKSNRPRARMHLAGPHNDLNSAATEC